MKKFGAQRLLSARPSSEGVFLKGGMNTEFYLPPRLRARSSARSAF
jgi:hypothetical protein